MAENQIKEGVMCAIMERNRRDDERAFQNFCEELLSLPANLELMPEKNFKADIELQPLRWMSLGIDLLKSRRVSGHVQLADGFQGPETGSYLPYPVFQMAAEIFLKGLWLCQYADCRELTHSSYMERDKRQTHSEILKELGHDLLTIVDKVRGISQYRADVPTMRFLELVERIIRVFYFPPYEADRGSRWADCRYPKRVYNDAIRVSSAESLTRYPEAKWVERLFRETEQHVNHLWELRAELSTIKLSTCEINSASSDVEN